MDDCSANLGCGLGWELSYGGELATYPLTSGAPVEFEEVSGASWSSLPGEPYPEHKSSFTRSHAATSSEVLDTGLPCLAFQQNEVGPGFEVFPDPTPTFVSGVIPSLAAWRVPEFTDNFVPNPEQLGAPPTTVTLERASPAAVATAVHEFLRHNRSEVLSCIVENFSIQAITFDVYGACCTLKAQVYSSLTDVGALKVEFMRLSGDGLVFGRTFCEARQRLHKSFPGQGSCIESAFVFPPPVPPLASLDDKEDDSDDDATKFLQLLVDKLASDSQFPDQSSVAILLWTMPRRLRRMLLLPQAQH